MTEADKHSRPRPIRMPDAIWEAYGRVCQRLGTDRAARTLDHIRTDIREHGDAEDLAALELGERELAERRSRKGGRPPKS